MKTVIESKLREEVLAHWRGADAKVWMFHATHRRLALVLSRPNEPEVIYVVANGCEYISGPICWKASDVSIHCLTGNAEEPNCRVVDSAAGFTLICYDAVVVKAPATEFPTSFDSFLES